MIPRADVQQLQGATRLHDRPVGSDQLAKSSAVDVRHVLEIQDDVSTLLRKETVDLVFEMLRAATSLPTISSTVTSPMGLSTPLMSMTAPPGVCLRELPVAHIRLTRTRY
jgi:hypothetical protein